MDKIGIIFLDFDGVINTRFYKIIDGKIKGNFYHERDMKINNIDGIKLLNKLCLDHQYGIVVTSSWRIHNKKYPVYKTLINSSLNPDISFLGITPILNDRSKEIIKWLLDNSYNIDDEYIILDDDILNYPLNERQIVTEFEIGFNNQKYNEAETKIKQIKKRL